MSRGMCRGCGYVGTKASMTRHQEGCEGRQQVGKTAEVYRLRVSGTDRPQYWLDVDVPVSANLDDLDGFLRGIWLECCGHMSQFTIGPEKDYSDDNPFKPPKKSRQPTLEKLNLQEGDRFGYTYDFGSGTDLTVQVQARETVMRSPRETVRLLARNLPPALTCSKCSEAARWVHSWEYDEESGLPVMYCTKHGKTTREEQLPVVNSPRMGVCGYEGGNDDDWPPAEGQVPQNGVSQNGVSKSEKLSRPRKPSTPKKADATPPNIPMLRLSADTSANDFQSFLDQVADWRDDEGEDVMAEARALPLNPDAVWVVATQPMPGLLPPSEPLPVVALVIDANTGQIVYNEVLPDPAPEEIVEVVLSAMLEPLNEDMPPQRPGTLLSVDAELVTMLQQALAALDIQVILAEVPPLAGLLAELKDAMYGAAQLRGGGLPGAGSGPQQLSTLTGQSDEDVRALLTAFTRWMKAKPWQVFSPTKPLYVRWLNPDGTSGQCYASVMGEQDEVYGLALYPTWDSLAGHIYNSADTELMMLATGGIESLSQSRVHHLHPDDWARLQACGLATTATTGPELMRFGDHGPETPLTPLRPLAALLNLMAARAESKHNQVTSLKGEEGGVKVVFPAGPRDELTPADRPGSIELRLKTHPVYGFKGEIVLVGPPDLQVRQAFLEARRTVEARDSLKDRLLFPFRLESHQHQSSQPGIFGPSYLRIWESDVQAPNLTLFHLLKWGHLVDSLGSTLDIRRLPDAVEGLTVEVRPNK